jgi:hypothetical protein
MKKLIFLFLLICAVTMLSAQVPTEEIEGLVTYVTTQNVYVKFLSAKRIKPGDQLFLRKEGILKPVIMVDNCSSMSCVGKLIGEEKLTVGEAVIAVVPLEADKKKEEKREEEIKKSVQPSNTLESSAPNKGSHKQAIDGRLLLSSYSNISNLETGDNFRLRYTLSLNAANIANSPFSFESYISFAHKLNDWAEIKENIFNGLKIYTLDLKYDLGKHTTFYLGRKINSQISSLGAIDGFQVETKLKQFYVGGVAGYRPDYEDYSFNSKLLEYGAYIGHNFQNKSGYMQTSVALFEQTNSGITDRRFAYFQHQNSLVKNLNLFVSSEVDLYRVDSTGSSFSDLLLTSLYVSVNYRPFKKLSIMGSYDNRKNVIYYETFKNYLDMLLEDASRQGVQLRVNYRPFNFMFTGISASYRVRDNDIRPTENLNGFLTFNQVPLIKASATLSANLLQTSYLNGTIYGLRLNKDLFAGKMSCGLNYRYVDYGFENGANDLIQHIGEIDMSVNFNRKFSLSLDYELTLEDQVNYHRVYLSAVKRF